MNPYLKIIILARNEARLFGHSKANLITLGLSYANTFWMARRWRKAYLHSTS